MKVIKAAGNGSCLFISLRLGLELRHVIRLINEGHTPTSCNLKGSCTEVMQSAEELRKMIMTWYDTGLFKDMPSLGTYTENGRLWVRGDILALEMVRRGSDVPESGAARTAAMLKYIEDMRIEGTWGSTPEYTAFAMMSKLHVQVYQFQQGTLARVNEVGPAGPIQGIVKLLYTGGTHYDLLVDDCDSVLIEANEKLASLVPMLRLPINCMPRSVGSEAACPDTV